ncbi:MAG: TPM domain-containing protein, partial [Kiritimatiellae bacterium]|nr:TPM domain-containing protein [Kiritimatiellia bacterium]
MKTSSWLGLVGFLLAMACAFAQGGVLESDQFREGLQPQGAVSDWGGVFTPQQKADLEARLTAAQAATGGELAIVTVASLKGGHIDDFAVKLFEQWGIGQKDKDNGVLLLAAIEDRKIRIEPGYGFEGALPDAKCGRILDEFIIPRFKEGDVAGGLMAGADVLLKVMAGDEIPAADPASVGEGIVQFIVVFIFVLIWGLVAWAAITGKRLGRGGGASGGGRISGGGFSSGGRGSRSSSGGFSGGRS